MSICIVLPTIRKIDSFKEKWSDLIKKHSIDLIVVHDGGNPVVELKDKTYSVKEMMGEYTDLIYNFNDGVRNLGFVLARKLKYDYILSLDDDVEPINDTVQDHLDALNKKYPVSWFSTSMTEYMRGFPYDIREESECWVSHGVWEGIPDYDAIRQLSGPINKQEFYKGPIPKGVFFPCCMMNTMFKKDALPYIYQAPMFDKINRFADIWGGIELKKDLDRLNKCVVSGYSKVLHNRLSDPCVNLLKESVGIRMNEEYGKGEYFKLFFEKRKKWAELSVMD